MYCTVLYLFYLCSIKTQKRPKRSPHKNTKKHKMKTLMLSLILATTTLFVAAQKSNAADVIYQELEDEENIFTLSLNKQMLQNIDTDLEWNDQIKYLKGDVKKVKVMLIGNEHQDKTLMKRIYKRLTKLGYKQIDLSDDTSEDDSTRVWIFSNKKGDTFTEAHFVIEDEDGSGIFMSVYGDFKLTD